MKDGGVFRGGKGNGWYVWGRKEGAVVVVYLGMERVLVVYLWKEEVMVGVLRN